MTNNQKIADKRRRIIKEKSHAGNAAEAVTAT